MSPFLLSLLIADNAFGCYLQILNLLQEGGAERSNYFSDFVTHLIAGYEAQENDISAAKDLYEIPAVTQNWILYSVKCNKLLPYPLTRITFNINHIYSQYYSSQYILTNKIVFYSLVSNYKFPEV